MTADDLIDQFLDACRRAAASRGERAQAIGRLIVRLANQLRERRDKLVERLTTGDRFLSEHPTRADYAALEDRWIKWLHSYTRIVDALAEGLSIWMPVEGTQ